MAAPTFTSISPSSGNPGGKYLVTIQGTDFEQHPDPPATGQTSGVLTPSMTVKFNGVAATQVYVYSTTLLTCIVPAYEGSVASLETGADVDIILTNIGPPEESVTETDGFNYSRNDLTRNGTLQRIIRFLLQKMKREIIANIMPFTSVDYDKTTGDTLNIVHLAETPGIGISDIDILDDPDYRDNDKVETTSGGTDYIYYDNTPFSRIVFTASIVSQGDPVEHFNLSQDFITFFKRNKILYIIKDNNDVTKGYVELPLYLLSKPSFGGVPNASDIILSNATFEIRGVAIDEDDLIPVKSGKILDDPADIEISSEQI
jgi:hypothetical protein